MTHRDNDHVTLLTRAAAPNMRVRYPAGCDAPVTHAARELARYLPALLAAPAIDVVIDRDLPPNTVAIGDRLLAARAADAANGLTPDGYAIVVDSSGVAISGTNPRGVLYGVYAVLHDLGCRWLTPDEDGEVLPVLDAVRLPVGTRMSSPDFRRRGLGEDTRAVPLDEPDWFADLLTDTRRLADWMAKNRMSHLTTTANALADAPSLQDDLAQRGIVSSYGTGHNIPRLLPRDLFLDHPEYFRMDDDGQRRTDGNLCVSNPDAVAILISNAVAEIRAADRPIELYSIQGEDRPEGSWCRCPDCRSMSPLEQNVLLCRAVADGLSQAGIDRTRVGLAAYQSTIEPSISPAALPDGCFVHFAPRERSYAEPLMTGVNCEYAEHLANWSALLGDDTVAVIEYYTDAVRFASLPVPLTRVIAADLRAYRDRGATAWLRVLFMSRYCWWAYSLNLYVVARLAWDADEPVKEIVADFCRNRYGPAGEAMVTFFDRFEQAMAHVVTTGEIDLAPDPPSQWKAQLDRAASLLEEVIALGEQALDACSADPYRRYVRRDLLAARFAASQIAALRHRSVDWDESREMSRAGIEALRNDPDAPHSSWLDSGCGIDLFFKG